jgi:hypothetical protein
VIPVSCHSGRLIRAGETGQAQEIQIQPDSSSESVNFFILNEDFIKVCGLAENIVR